MTVIPGTTDPEALLGTPDGDLITAYGGNDTVYGFSGNDTVYGGAGDDSLEGQFGNDLLFGEAGNDSLISGGDSDQLFGGDGNDVLFLGGLDNSSLFVDLATETLDGHGAFDHVTFEGMERLIVLSNGGDDSIYGGAPNDDIQVGSGHNIVAAKDGDDRVSYVALGASTLMGVSAKTR